MPSPCNPATLSDQELTTALAKLNREDHKLTARLVARIAAFDARQLYLAKAYSSMHVYCTDQLGMTDAEAFRRIHAGRAARKHPQILALIHIRLPPCSCAAVISKGTPVSTYLAGFWALRPFVGRVGSSAWSIAPTFAIGSKRQTTTQEPSP